MTANAPLCKSFTSTTLFGFLLLMSRARLPSRCPSDRDKSAACRLFGFQTAPVIAVDPAPDAATALRAQTLEQDHGNLSGRRSWTPDEVLGLVSELFADWPADIGAPRFEARCLI
jgi:hypothetical protein